MLVEQQNGLNSCRIYDGTLKKTTKAVNEVVAEILEQFPPGGKK